MKFDPNMKNPPNEIVEAAQKVGDWFAGQNITGWSLGPCSQRAHEPAPAPRKHGHYFRDFPFDDIDFYRLALVYQITDPCIQHVIKKLLATGRRGGGKDATHDVQDCIDTLERWKAMRAEEQAVKDAYVADSIEAFASAGLSGCAGGAMPSGAGAVHASLGGAGRPFPNATTPDPADVLVAHEEAADRMAVVKGDMTVNTYRTRKEARDASQGAAPGLIASTPEVDAARRESGWHGLNPLARIFTAQGGLIGHMEPFSSGDFCPREEGVYVRAYPASIGTASYREYYAYWKDGRFGVGYSGLVQCAQSGAKSGPGPNNLFWRRLTADERAQIDAAKPA